MTQCDRFVVWVVACVVVSVTCASAWAQSSPLLFPGPISYDVGDNPRSVAIGDLDGDGQADLAVANRYSDSVSVLLGQGGGVFGAATDYVMGSVGTALAIGDLSGNGHLDLAVADFWSSSFAIFLNQSSPWVDLGGGTVGSAGAPSLVGSGSLLPGTDYSLDLSGAPPFAHLVGWFSFQPVVFQAAGGTVHAHPFQHERLFMADATGSFVGVSRWPAVFPAGMEVWFQFFIQDSATLHGFTMTNGLLGTTPD